MTNVVESVNENKNRLVSIFKGIIIALLITTILIFIFSIILSYTNMAESSIPTGTIIISGVSILIGAFLSTHHIKKNGIVNGAVVGGIYVLTIYLLSSIISGNFAINSVNSIVMIIMCILTGGVGGVIGVNTRKK